LAVRGPDNDGTEKALQFLFPSEFSELMACDKVPVAWRRNVAIATYLCLRDGEQRALKWSAVDLTHGVVTVAEVVDRRTGEDREGTKSNTARTVPIPAPLMPLLEAMHKDSGGKGTVCPRWTTLHLARDLRRWLWIANVRREALHTKTKVSKPMRWHDLRASGLTWYAVEGRSSTEIRDIAGHTMTSMTDRYMRAAGVLRGDRFGRPFPPLPEYLTEFPNVSETPDQSSTITVSYGGGAGNRTRVRKRLAPASTCVADELYRPELRPSAGSPRR
jgi:integrase